MRITATAIYENGILHLLTPVDLPQQTRVRVEIQSEESAKPEDKIATAEEIERALAPLVAAGIVSPPPGSPTQSRRISDARRQELAQIYAQGESLSEIIIQEREDRI